ncbi:MAG: hypothetical protein U9Q34_01255, partial [Elusimicrobiota bacterium]|nr:hypothetical protein [Elusimicrobiota bacterium]
LKDFTAKTKYDALIFIDLPYGDEQVVPYAWFSKRDKTKKKFFIANDTLPSRGAIFGMDLAEDLCLIKNFTAAYVLDYQGLNVWRRFKLKDRVFKRRFAVDCDYFDGKSSSGNYVFSYGNISRNFNALFEAMILMPDLKLKLYGNYKLSAPPILKNRVQFIAPSADSSKMKQLIAGAKFIVFPTLPDKKIRTVGLSSALVAMAMKKIVLVRGNMHMYRYLTNGINAFMYKKSNAAELLRGMKKILSLSASEKKQIELKARETVLKMNNMDSFADEFIKKHIKR